MPIRPVHIALADDHILLLKTLANFLSDQPNFSVIFQAPNMAELLSKLKSSLPEVLVLDLFMPNMSGNDAIRLIRSEYPSIRILVLSMSQDMELISDLLDLGIHGYISKSDDPEELVQAINAASVDRIYRNRVFTEALYWNKQNNIKAYTPGFLVLLNEREIKILNLIWEEKSNREIADELFLGVRSVEKIRQDIKEKIGVKSTVGLLKYAIDKKIIKISSGSAGHPNQVIR